MSTNFTDILNKRADEIERPKPLPVGTYLGMVQGAPEFGNIGKENTAVANFTIRLLQANDDVDREALANVGGLDGKTVRHRFFLTDAAMYRLKEFLVNDLQIEEGTSTLGQLVSEAAGRQVYLTIKHRPSQDGSQIYHEVGSTAKV